LVGSNLVPRLLSAGAQVRATLHHRSPVAVDDRVEYLHADLTTSEDCRRVVEGQRFVFMCAASTSGAAAIASTPMIHVTPNIIMNSLMLEAAYEAEVEKFLWLSSTTGYPPSGDHLVQEDEMFAGEPYETYYFSGWLKRFTEILCKMYGEKLAKPMTTIVLRPTNIYGPNDDFEPATSHVTAALIRKVAERQDPIEVWGTGDDVRDVIYVDDMVDAIMSAMETIDCHTSLNIGLGEGYSVKQILNTILELAGYDDARIVYDPSKPSMIPIRLVDTSKAQAVLGFRAKTQLREGLRSTLDCYTKSREKLEAPVAGRE
ncbi:MAG: NAD-dependent epimerase/dehydratase family protein, partial [Opitutales bacterium]